MNILAEIICIGDELLAGYTVNTNATFISQQLRSIGISVKWVTTISDEHDEILSALEEANERAGIIMVTGGLGPTPDDITKKAICVYFKKELVEHPDALNDLRNFIIVRGRSEKFLEMNRGQALVPQDARVIRNTFGTAPGIILKNKESWFSFMPGVPKEMKAMVSNFYLDFLKDQFPLPKINTYLLRTTGIAESSLHDLLKGTLEKYDQFPLAFLPKAIGVDLRFRFTSNINESIEEWQNFIANVRKKAGKYIFTEDERDLEQVMVEMLTEKKLTLSVAESFTGGLLQDRITNVPGSSIPFLGGIITYSNDAKLTFTNVSRNTLKEYGAVSEQVALEMVQGIQRKFNSDCAVSTTGIAGPGGASEDKPVGLCYIAVRYKEKEKVRQFHFGPDRIINKMRGAVAGLEMLRRIILE